MSVRLISVLILMGFSAMAQGVLIDHSCTDLSQVPPVWIEAVKSSLQSHYAHTSHGGQLTYGLDFVEDDVPLCDAEVGIGYLPQVSGAYCVFDGQENESYVTPDLYWESSEGLNLTRDVLDGNPALDTSMWCWCSQCDYYDQSQVQAYLDAMSQLESEYPEVTFVYFTGNAQATGSEGYNRFLRNNQIRDYCTANDKVLFDFADMDAWWYNPSSFQWEHHTYQYNGTAVPAEHPQYYGDEYGHTTAESCYNKGSAWWWMMAVLAGWGTSGASVEYISDGLPYLVEIPSPVSDRATIKVSLSEVLPLEIMVFDAAGRRAAEISAASLPGGSHQFQLSGLECGVYLIGLDAGGYRSSHRMVVVN